jgi:hypothetical protein
VCQQQGQVGRIDATIVVEVALAVTDVPDR